MKNNLGSLIIGISIVITAIIFANAFQNSNRTYDTISVTGMAKKDFVSDLIVWKGSFVRKNINLKEAYLELDKDREKDTILSYLKRLKARGYDIFCGQNTERIRKQI